MEIGDLVTRVIPTRLWDIDVVARVIDIYTRNFRGYVTVRLPNGQVSVGNGYDKIIVVQKKRDRSHIRQMGYKIETTI